MFNYNPRTGTLRKEASLLTFPSISFIFRGVSG